MQCKDVAQVIEQEGFSPLPEAARGHVAGCASCASLIADFEQILAIAHELPAEVEPPSHLWISLRAQLEAEKIIHESDDHVVRAKSAPWWQGFGQMIRGRMLATAAIALLVVAAGYFQMTQKLVDHAVNETTDTAKPVSAVVNPEPFADTASTLDQEERNIYPVQPASLSAASSPVDNSLRENLAKLNAFIKECRKRLQEDPNDQMARDYLSAAYQQKAEILAAMMERGRSVN